MVTFSASVGASVETAETEVWTVAVRLAGGPTGGHLATQENEERIKQTNKHLSKQSNETKKLTTNTVRLTWQSTLVWWIMYIIRW